MRIAAIRKRIWLLPNSPSIEPARSNRPLAEIIRPRPPGLHRA